MFESSDKIEENSINLTFRIVLSVGKVLAKGHRQNSFAKLCFMTSFMMSSGGARKEFALTAIAPTAKWFVMHEKKIDLFFFRWYARV